MIAATRLLVAVPARDEATTIGRCLDAIQVASDRARANRPSPVIEVVVAADACSDQTADIARTYGVTTLETKHGRVGAARAAAISTGLERLGPSVASVWIANTDADSTVAPGWLDVHLDAAEAGADLLLGSVRIDPRTADGTLLARWMRLNPPAHDHRYVHGANLGFRADAYLACGGFQARSVDEDVLLVDRFRHDGRRIVSTDHAPVLTSGRIVGRAPGGFATYLRKTTRLDTPEIYAPRGAP